MHQPNNTDFLKTISTDIATNGLKNTNIPPGLQDWLGGRILKIFPENLLKKLLTHLSNCVRENEFILSSTDDDYDDDDHFNDKLNLNNLSEEQKFLKIILVDEFKKPEIHVTSKELLPSLVETLKKNDQNRHHTSLHLEKQIEQAELLNANNVNIKLEKIHDQEFTQDQEFETKNDNLTTTSDHVADGPCGLLDDSINTCVNTNMNLNDLNLVNSEINLDFLKPQLDEFLTDIAKETKQEKDTTAEQEVNTSALINSKLITTPKVKQQLKNIKCYKCKSCGLSYTRNADLRRHMRKVHPNELAADLDIIKCENCSSLVLKWKMKDHVKRLCKLRPNIKFEVGQLTMNQDGIPHEDYDDNDDNDDNDDKIELFHNNNNSPSLSLLSGVDLLGLNSFCKE